MRALASTCSRVRLRASRPDRHATRAGTAAGTLCGGRLDRVPPARAGAAADGAGDSRARDDRLGRPARACTHPCHICTGTGLTPATSAPGLGSPMPRLHRDWAQRCHICTGTGPHLPRLLGSPLPRLHRDWPTAATSAPGLGLRAARSAPASPTRRIWSGLCDASSTPRVQVHRIMEEMHQELVNETWFSWCASAHATVSCGCARA